MSDKKIVFVAFAIEDESSRNLLKGHAVNARCPFEYIDMSVKEAYETDWKSKVETRIKRSDGVIALVSKHSANSTGQKWEIECAKKNGVPVIGMRISSSDTSSIPGVTTIPWDWDRIATFIDGL